MKAPIIAKETNMRLNGPPFVTVPVIPSLPVMAYEHQEYQGVRGTVSHYVKEKHAAVHSVFP